MKTLRKSGKSLAAPQACLHEPRNFRASTQTGVEKNDDDIKPDARGFIFGQIVIFG